MRFLLFPLAWIYRSGGFIRNVFYDLGIFSIKTAPLPVISIGNISFGGSEKTPLAMKLIEKLLAQSFRPALVSRGYRGKWEKPGGILSDGKSRRGTWQDSGDEPFMLSQNYPEAGVFVGKNRLASCSRAVEIGFKPAVLDDGFQHRKLARDIDIVLFDPQERIKLREPVSALKRADIVLLKRGHNNRHAQRWATRFPKPNWFEYEVISQGIYSLASQTPVPPGSLGSGGIFAFCGIANPFRFKDMLKKEGIEPLRFHTFKDHHAYPQTSILRLKNIFHATKAKAMITTEKDAVKLADVPEFKDFPLYFLKIDLDIEEGFFSQVLSHLKRVEQKS